MTKMIVVTVEGGIVNSVCADGFDTEGVHVVLIDYDTEGGQEPDDVEAIGGSEAYVNIQAPDELCSSVRKTVEIILQERGIVVPPKSPAADGLPEEERAIAGKLIRTILAAGYAIRVWEGEGWACAQSADFDTVWAALASTDQDVLHVYDGPERRVRRGFVHLVYGNGADLIADNSDNALINALVTAAEQAPAPPLTTASEAPAYVFVGIYDHKHGTDVAVYATQEAAEAQRLILAKEYWDDRPNNADTPDDPEGLTDAEIIAAYWGDNDRESFQVEERAIED